MKQKILFWVLVLVMFAIIFLLPGCSPKPITGQIKEVNGDTVRIKHYTFKVLTNVPKIGQNCVFIPTTDSSKINCIKL